ncbi:glycerol-3-phosphate ABC transporter substrate-binding protein [Nostoc sp. FACHB-190]|uniref:glycerol-3-phosphate ABC transporter substrate-binding protein n=1 Tax=Nostoc sp. FACHB-190 TaxID=2692838 RepID=UPI001686D425|nr:glycerol-3-phosphate ABC transporter substrate-binding protein [Nostoc sp. FACHB-190]MBD2303175.1 glycerol-3-phosphate ABC transporter substrate-binding protein [Nostoc sp. FACHB-190]
MLAEYSSEVFSKLRDFDTAKTKLLEVEKILPELGCIIRKYDLQEKIGICLLHKHFNIDETERLVENFQDGKFYSRPVKYNNELCLVPHTWKLEILSNNVFNWYPLEFGYRNNLDLPIIDNLDFFVEMSLTLSTLNMEDTFGVTVLHRDFITLDRDEILIETSDDSQRVLIVSSVKKSIVDKDKDLLTQTIWKFSSNNLEHHCSGHCHHCNQHCHHCYGCCLVHG